MPRLMGGDYFITTHNAVYTPALDRLKPTPRTFNIRNMYAMKQIPSARTPPIPSTLRFIDVILLLSFQP